MKIPEMTLLEFSIFWGCKLAYAVYMFVIPAMFSHHSGWSIIFLYFVVQVNLFTFPASFLLNDHIPPDFMT